MMDPVKIEILSQIEVALEIAMKTHKGQRDLDGMPVILHPLTVALKGNNEYGKFRQAKFAFQFEKKPIGDTTAQTGITVDEYMRFFHPERSE